MGAGLLAKTAAQALKIPQTNKSPDQTGRGFLFLPPYSITQIRLMNRLITMRRPLILRWPDRFVPTQVIIGMQRPIRIPQQLSGEEDDVRLTGAQNVLGLGRFGDHSYRTGGNA